MISCNAVRHSTEPRIRDGTGDYRVSQATVWEVSFITSDVKNTAVQALYEALEQ